MTVRACPVFEWFTERTGYVPSRNARGIEAVLPDGRRAGMVVCDGWTPGAVWMHVAVVVPGACRGLLRAAFSYVFEESGRGLALGQVRASNKRSLALARHLGFEVTGRIRDGWAEGEDVVLLALRREDCRWIQQQRRAA